MRRVSYHQSVFDLLGIQPGESPQALELIEACERRCGRRLPEAVRQWYLIEGTVALRHDDDWHVRASGQRGHLWYDYSNMDWPESLEAVLRQFAGELYDAGERVAGRPAGAVRVMLENQGVCRWYVRPDGSDNPPVIVDETYDQRARRTVCWVQVAARFSDFLFDWFARFYEQEWTPISERDHVPERRTRPACEKPYLNGLWLYAPEAESVAPPYIDYLIENLDEGSRLEIAPGVMQYHFQDDHGSIRVTTDLYGEEGGVSAWWLYADSEEELFRLTRGVSWCCDLPVKLRAWTEVARPVLERLRNADGGEPAGEVPS